MPKESYLDRFINNKIVIPTDYTNLNQVKAEL